MLSIFETLTLLFAFGMLLISLLSFVDKRRK